MRTFFIVNPAAGRGTARKVWAHLQSVLTGQGECDWAFTKGHGHATELARTAVQRGFGRVAALGGDGTICQVAEGLVNTPAALAVVPGGTGNDYCRSTGIPEDPLSAARLAMVGDIRRVDVGEIRANTGPARYFLNVAGAGFDAEVARSVNAYPKYLGGTIPYLLGIVTTLWRYTPVELEVIADGTQFRRRSLLIAVGLGQFYGGGMHIVPDAMMDDGLFDLCIAGDLGRLETLQLVPKIYTAGHVGHPKVEFLRCREVRLDSPAAVAAQADGELVGRLPITLRVLPGALGLVTPTATGPGFSHTTNRP